MQPHEQRVVAERDDLADKLTKLKSFIDGEIFKKLPLDERIRMEHQSYAMQEYLDILNERINAFPPPPLSI